MKLFQPSEGWRQLAVVAVASGWVAHAAAQSGPAAHDPLQNESAPMHSAMDASADAVPSPPPPTPAKGKKHSRTKAAAPRASTQPEFSVDAPQAVSAEATAPAMRGSAAVPAVPAIMPALVSVVSLPGARTILLPLGSYPNY